MYSYVALGGTLLISSEEGHRKGNGGLGRAESSIILRGIVGGKARERERVCVCLCNRFKFTVT